MKKYSVIVCATTVLIQALCFAPDCAPELSFNEYLTQVEGKNPDLKAANVLIESISRKILELDMVYSPFLGGGLGYSDDRSGPGYSSVLYSKETQIRNWGVSLSKKWRTGSTVAFGYSSVRATFDLISPLTYPGIGTLSYFDAYSIQPFLKFEQSLLRDFRSGVTEAGIRKNKSAALAGRYLQVLKAQQILLQAKSAYMALSLAREVVAFRRDALARANDLVEWAQKRVEMDLADKGDLLQAQAALRLRKLNLEMAVQQERKATRDFNEMRGAASDLAGEKLEKISEMALYCVNVTTLTVAGKRADVLAAEAGYESAKFAKIETKFRSYPEVTFSGAAQLYGIDLTHSGAWNQIAAAQKPSYSIGINLVAPLDVFTLSKVRKGYEMDFDAARLTLEKARISANKDREQLNENWNNVRVRLSLANEIKDLQSQRLENERARYSKGRTTTFSIIQAENDLDDATLGVYNLAFEQMMTFAQSELYNTRELK